MPKTGEAKTCQCPWCGKNVQPVHNYGEGQSVFGYQDKSRWMATNPAMCPLCLGVGSYEDFGMEVA